MTEELRKGFHERARRRPQGLTQLAASVIEAIPRATAVLLDGDLEGADYLLLADDEIDARSLELEERCYQVLALQAPVASDLRQVMAAVQDDQRDRALRRPVRQHLQGGATHLRPELDPKLRGIITRMGEQAQQLFKFAIDAYVEDDAGPASAIDDMDDLDRLQPSSSSRSSRATPRAASPCRSPCSWRSWPGSTSGSATTPSTSASGCGTWSPVGCRATRASSDTSRRPGTTPPTAVPEPVTWRRSAAAARRRRTRFATRADRADPRARRGRGRTPPAAHRARRARHRRRAGRPPTASCRSATPLRAPSPAMTPCC